MKSAARRWQLYPAQGAVAERFGAPIAQGAYAIAAIIVMLVIVALVPSLRKLE